ncbi:hypothetical protein Tco_0409665 [Tanacetum coccineum]
MELREVLSSRWIREDIPRKSIIPTSAKPNPAEECSILALVPKALPNGDPNHLIGECPKPPKYKNQRAFVRGSWSDSGEEDDEKLKDEKCLVAQASNEICLGVDLEPDEWIKDSGCSKHMTGN